MFSQFKHNLWGSMPQTKAGQWQRVPLDVHQAVWDFCNKEPPKPSSHICVLLLFEWRSTPWPVWSPCLQWLFKTFGKGLLNMEIKELLTEAFGTHSYMSASPLFYMLLNYLIYLRFYFHFSNIFKCKTKKITCLIQHKCNLLSVWDQIITFLHFFWFSFKYLLTFTFWILLKIVNRSDL